MFSLLFNIEFLVVDQYAQNSPSFNILPQTNTIENRLPNKKTQLLTYPSLECIYWPFQEKDIQMVLVTNQKPTSNLRR